MKTIEGKSLLKMVRNALIACVMGFASMAHAADEMHFINLAGFYILDNGYKFPAEIKGNEAVLLSTLDGKGHYIFMSHESGVAHDDVINIQNNLLRSQAGAFEDFGIDCNFSVMMKDDAGKHNGIRITGNCNAHLMKHDGNHIETSTLVKPTELPDIESEADERWKLIFNDGKGVVIYANAES